MGLVLFVNRQEMQREIQAIVVPALREMGFRGSFPHYRRIVANRIDLLTFQFNLSGGSFVVEIGSCSTDGITTHWGKHIAPNQVSAHDLHPNQRFRLGSNPLKGISDYWFSFSKLNSKKELDALCDFVVQQIKSPGELWWNRSR